MQKTAWILGLILGLWGWFVTGSPAAEPEPYRWGQTLEEMNQVLQRTGPADEELREDLYGSRVVLPYKPLKSIEVLKGNVTTVYLMKKGEGRVALGQLFGYLHKGKMFCRAQLFRDSPLFSKQEIVAQLKKKYPAGQTTRVLTGNTFLTFFEYLSADQYVFTNELGVYRCDPGALNRVVAEVQKDIGARDAKDLEQERELFNNPR